MFKKILTIIPFIIVCIITLVNWLSIIFTTVAATPKHYITLVLVLANAVSYFIKYKFSILFTGVILVLATFNLLTFYAETITWFMNFNLGFVISTPGIQLWSLLLLILHCAVNFNQLVGWYLDAKGYKEGELK